MKIDFAREYQAKTDQELLRLALKREQLTAEANACLARELAKRRIDDAEHLCAFQEEEKSRNAHWKLEPIVSSGVPGREPYTVGPPLPSEGPKPPWPPKTAGRIAFFLGPVAGALVAAISLRRMGHQQKAKKVMLLTLLATGAEATILFFIPAALSRGLALVAEIAFFLIFPALEEREFRGWEAANPDGKPSSGWKAIGWGIAGAVLFFVICFAVFIVLGALVPESQ